MSAMGGGRMLGRFETPGCCPGMKQGWTRTRHLTGGDCSGAITSTRKFKRKEQQDVRRLIDRAIRERDTADVA